MKPSHLPRARLQVIRHLTDPATPLRSGVDDDNRVAFDEEASRLRVAELYWVAPDMAALAMSAGAQLAAASWATIDRPSPCGLMVFDGGIGTMTSLGTAGRKSVEMPVWAISWGPADGVLSLGLWMSRTLLAEKVSTFATLQVDQTPPLIPIRSFTVPVSADPVPFAALEDPEAPVPVFAALAAAWLLMQQPTLVERRAENPDKATARAATRAGQPASPVSIIDLRRAYAPDSRQEDGETGGRQYRHRWVVQGHWRDQPHGKDRALRRKQWIPAHIKGPDGAPLLATERVNVWRR